MKHKRRRDPCSDPDNHLDMPWFNNKSKDQICKLFKWLPCNIFKIYTERAVENVSDGISRLLEAEKFKTKEKWDMFCWTPCIMPRFKRYCSPLCKFIYSSKIRKRCHVIVWKPFGTFWMIMPRILLHFFRNQKPRITLHVSEWRPDLTKWRVTPHSTGSNTWYKVFELKISDDCIIYDEIFTIYILIVFCLKYWVTVQLDKK